MQPGFVALSARPGDPLPDLRALLSPVVGAVVRIEHHGTVAVAWWGLTGELGPGEPVLLTQRVRTRTSDLTAATAGALVRAGRESAILPPFGILAVDGDAVTMRADTMGFRQLYRAETGSVAGLSTSAGLLARCLGRDLDREAVAVQSLLGWQLGQRSLFAGVTKLAPGEVARLADGRVSTWITTAPPEPSSLGLDDAVRRSARLLRESLTAYLSDRPDAVLQLTGGQDSRLLLSAIPPGLRRGRPVMTLGEADHPDVAVAGEIAERYDLRHEVHGMTGLATLDPADAWRRCRDAARRLDAMADPLAFAALAWAEAQFMPAPRLSGLGGEVARGFYYLGPRRSVPVTRARAVRLAGWRMFANEAVEAGALPTDQVGRTRAVAETEVWSALERSGPGWLEATDELYLRHRMQRWAGVTDTAWCFEREIANPMLDHDFLTIAARLAPADKRGSQFLARLQMALDPELARLPLEGRPAPEAYSRRTAATSAALLASAGRRLGRKVRQRVGRTHRPPAGGTVLAAQVVRHWRDAPDLLDGVRQTSVVDQRWLDQVLTGAVQPEPGSVAFVTNVAVATELLDISQNVAYVQT